MERQITKKKKKISDDQSTCRAHSDPIPLDLIPEILKALPVKTLARFLCVSKQWESIIHNRDFMKSYLIKSSNRPQGLLFTFQSKRFGKNFFFSASHPQNQGESSSSLATYHMKCHSKPYRTVAPSVHGLICHGPSSKLMVYNPSTRGSITLPKIDPQRIDMYHFLGYDPIDGDYKVLYMTMTRGTPVFLGRGLAQELRVLTLGNGNSWRVIEDYPPHFLDFADYPDICIDGVLYYIALDAYMSYAVMSFDVRSENFDLIKVPESASHPKLTNYEGKLALLSYRFSEARIKMWVLEDAGKNEWSKKLYVLPIIQGQNYIAFYPYCATNEGELVLAKESMLEKPFYVLYYHPKKNTVRRVYIEGISELKLPIWDKEVYHDMISVVSGQADNLMFL